VSKTSPKPNFWAVLIGIGMIGIGFLPIMAPPSRITRCGYDPDFGPGCVTEVSPSGVERGMGVFLVLFGVVLLWAGLRGTRFEKGEPGRYEHWGAEPHGDY
jgi:hypothetical protein